MSLLIMVLSAAVIIAAVRFGLLQGLDHVGGALSWSVKARGQATGYATSVPEFVCLVAAGLAGVWEAGLWNIASSNIINAVLMFAAALWYRQLGRVFARRFTDELLFAAAAIAVPVVLMRMEMDRSWLVVPILLAFFVLYRYVDRKLNAGPPAVDDLPAAGNLRLGVLLLVTGLVTIALAGVFLGDATEQVVNRLGVHPAVAGWILGFCTSLPEMVTFFAVYQSAKETGALGSGADTQEALDNLTASNMSNVGLIYPIGLAVFLIVGFLR